MKLVCVLLNIFLFVSGCEIYEKKSLSECRDFLIYLQTLFDFYSGLDLIFSIPPMKKFETEGRLETLVRLINEGPVKYQIQIFNFKVGQESKIGDGLVKVILYDTMNMEEFLKSKDFILESKYTWILIGKGETSWLKSVQLNFNSHVILAKSVNDEIVMTSVTGNNGKVILTPAGKWKKEDKFLYDSDVDYSIEDYEVALLIPHDPPFTIVHKDKDGNTTISGYLMDIWNAYEEFLGIKSSIVVSNKTNGGSIVKGNWTGIIGEMIHNDREVALVAKPETLEIAHLFDSLTLIDLRLAIYQRRETPNTWLIATEVKSNMIPFFLIVLAAIGGMILSRIGVERRDSFFMVLTIYLQQSCALPKCLASRIVTISLILMTLNVVNVNIGDVTSLLIRNKFTNIVDVKELIDPANKVVIVAHSTTHHILQDANDQTLTRIYDRVQITKGFVANVSEGLKQVMEKGVIFLETKEKADYFMAGYEEKIVKTLTHYNIPGGLLIRKNTVLTQRLYYQLLKFREIGFLSKVAAKWWREENQLPFRYDPVGVSNSWQLFVNFYAGVFVSFLVFILEKYYHRVHRTNLYR